MWMNPEVTNPESHHYDKLIDGKSGWLNIGWFAVRGLILLQDGVYTVTLHVNFLSRKIQPKIKVTLKSLSVFLRHS